MCVSGTGNGGSATHTECVKQRLVETEKELKRLKKLIAQQETTTVSQVTPAGMGYRTAIYYAVYFAMLVLQVVADTVNIYTDNDIHAAGTTPPKQLAVPVEVFKSVAGQPIASISMFTTFVIWYTYTHRIKDTNLGYKAFMLILLYAWSSVYRMHSQYMSESKKIFDYPFLCSMAMVFCFGVLQEFTAMLGGDDYTEAHTCSFDHLGRKPLTMQFVDKKLLQRLKESERLSR
jgi:hypothetical protein